MAEKWLSLGIDGNNVKEEISFDVRGDGDKSGLGFTINQAVIKRTYEGEAHPLAVVDANKAFQTHSDGYTPSRDLKHVASIPLWVVEEWIKIYGVDPTARGNERLLSRLLNDPDWRWLRTGLGRVDFKEAGS